MRRVPCPNCDGDDREGCSTCDGAGTVEETATVFRMFPEGDVVALFPTIPADLSGHCSSYQRIGQHGAADYHHVLGRTRLARPEEYLSPMAELTRIGYAVRTVRRASRRMHEARRAELRTGSGGPGSCGAAERAMTDLRDRFFERGARRDNTRIDRRTCRCQATTP
jgi:hypothetical protein